MNLIVRLLVSLLLVAALGPQYANAALVLDLNTGGASNVCGTSCGTTGATFGWSFLAINPITIDGLGVWDSGADGLGVTAPTGLWSAAGALLASATITDASTRVTSASADGDWLFEDIAPLTLAPGNYVIGTVFQESAPLAQTSFSVFTPFITISDITFGGGVQSGTANDGFAFPGTSFYTPIFGPTMRVAAVPEPATFALLLAGLGLVGLAVCRKNRGVSWIYFGGKEWGLSPFFGQI